MCMILAKFHHKFPRISLTRKTVYKVVRRDPRGDADVALTAYRDHEFVKGQMQHASIVFNSRNKCEINEGIHAFPTLESAIAELKAVSYKVDGDRYHIREFIIPSMSLYYVGFWEYYWPQREVPNVVSNYMTMGDIVDIPDELYAKIPRNR